MFRTITDEEYSTFDNIRQGNDWGYATDPLAFVRLHYDKILTIADSAEPKSISEMKKEYGCNFKGAKKGPGSVEFWENWLDDLEEIVIDAKRTPNVAREFENIDYQTDKDGT